MVEIDYSVRGMLYDYDYDCIRYREILRRWIGGRRARKLDNSRHVLCRRMYRAFV